MNTTGLSLDQAPPYQSIVKFFLAAPIFGALFGVLILISDNSNIYDRFSPQTIGLVHIYTLGFIAMAIFGALMQMLPVLAGIKTPKAKLVANITHTLLTFSVIAFFIGFYDNIQIAKKIAAIGFAFIVAIYFLPLIYATLKAGFKNFTIWGMRLSIVFGTLAFLLGIHLLASYAFGKVTANHIAFANLHIASAVFGFVSILIIAVAHQILPMFYVAPDFPTFCKKFLFILAIAILMYYATFTIEYASVVFNIAVGIILLAFSIVGLKKISQRKRKVSDTSLKLWQFGLCMLAIFSILLIVSRFYAIPRIEYLLVVLFGFGFATSIIIAMLNKIVPFLAWFHLINEGVFDAPNINELVSKKALMMQTSIYISSFILLICGYFYQQAINIAGAFLLLSFMFMFFNLLKVSKTYLKLSKQNNL